ncbi:hypothetical protein BUALT_Bualt11G0049100 [Buddleja alternifolia]|uniref:Uncharacterized protein n=1 Tax=Buddleja alternifolia TaxID=168488 RepID=A0AAV6X3G4_9LAMI|nr:hypothetical protein BUALT_Bualt11G0049100 [Buddleja alternifolia]
MVAKKVRTVAADDKVDQFELDDKLLALEKLHDLQEELEQVGLDENEACTGLVPRIKLFAISGSSAEADHVDSLHNSSNYEMIRNCQEVKCKLMKKANDSEVTDEVKDRVF